MPRPLPTVRAGGWYHVTHRGVDGSILFPTPQSKDAFIAELGEVAYHFPVEFHAYCAMETHYHLLARAPEEQLRHAVDQLEAGLPTLTDDARFRRMAVGRHLLQVTRYIHLNPVEAGMVRKPEQWAWSSYRGYLDALEGPRWLRSRSVLGWLGSIGARQRYRQYVEGLDMNMYPRYV